MFSRLVSEQHRRLVVGGFFGLLLAVGLLLVPSYGISTDEGLSRLNGQVTVFYLFQHLPPSLQHRLLDASTATQVAGKGAAYQLATFVDRDYGVAFELPVNVAERLLRLHDERAIYLFRHYCNFLVGFLGIIGFYGVATERFRSWRVGLLAALLLVLSPRLFADNFYNTKDAVFMAFMTLAVATAVRFIKRPTLGWAAWHAAACALAIDVRVMGILVPAATLALVGLRAARGEYGSLRAVWRAVAAYCLLAAGLVVACWPYLWAAPLTNLLAAFHNMSHFRWTGTSLLNGQQYREHELPWSYAPIWIGITTPLLYLAAFAVGLASMLAQLVRRRGRLYATDAEWQDLLFLGLGLAPLLAVILLHSVLYDGWRQLYFAYPMLLLVALRGLLAVWHWRPGGAAWWQPALSTGVAACLLVTATQMVRLHPYQNVYFNSLARQPLEANYAVDYWGLSYQRGMEWIAAHDARPEVRVYSPLKHPVVLSRLMLPLAERARIRLVDQPAQADYFVTNYLFHPQPYPYPGLAYTVAAGGTRLLGVYRLREPIIAQAALPSRTGRR
ncbi:MAG: phospholipid carrier-dependent glycosyltransferase [Hymenobacter sp.]|nr:MAG: phospholipid carrier-dependent glycosyltransferase [Hymenobacter sp.]